MKKKVLSALLSVAMVATVLMGCGSAAEEAAPAATEEAAPEIEKDCYLTKTLQDLECIAQANYDFIQMNLKNGNYTNEQANEIARTVIPIGVATECNVAVNLECLIHLANVRLCNRAELPIRTIVKEMVRQVVEVEPRYKPFLVPNCKKLGYCPEGDHSCKK